MSEPNTTATSAITHVSIYAMPFELNGHSELRLVALEGKQFVASLNMANWGNAVVTLFQLFVLPDRRGRGLGRALVEEACRVAGENDATAASAIVEEDGPVGFWSALGFRPTHIEGKRLILTRFLKGE